MSPVRSWATNDLEQLRGLYEECLRLLDTQAVDDKRAQSSGYYFAQSRAMSAAFEALPRLLALADEAAAIVWSEVRIGSILHGYLTSDLHVNRLRNAFQDLSYPLKEVPKTT